MSHCFSLFDFGFRLVSSWLSVSGPIRWVGLAIYLGEGLFRDVFDSKNEQRGLHLLRNRRPQLRNFLVRCKRGAAVFMARFGCSSLGSGLGLGLKLGWELCKYSTFSCLRCTMSFGHDDVYLWRFLSFFSVRFDLYIHASIYCGGP